jgi:hypothetical protein
MNTNIILPKLLNEKRQPIQSNENGPIHVYKNFRHLFKIIQLTVGVAVEDTSVTENCSKNVSVFYQ